MSFWDRLYLTIHTYWALRGYKNGGRACDGCDGPILEIWPKSVSEGLYLELSVIAEDGHVGKAVWPERALGSQTVCT